MEPLDETLLAGMAAGDQQAAATFVRRYQGRVIGLAMTLVGDAATSEEVAQETFLRVWRHAGAYDARRGRVATWVLAIARNLAIDQLRLRRAKPIDPQRLALLDAEVLGVVRGHGADDPGEVGRLRDALAELPAEQRRALLLAALCGLTAREIGEVEQAPVGTAKTRIRAAMQKLRVNLEAADER